jgi:transposase
MDQGSPHYAEALVRYLENVKEPLEVFWLPHYSPELNLIERLWKHLKASRTANVLPPSFEAFTRHLHDALTQLALNPDFALSVPAPTSQRTRQKNILVAT